MNKNYYAVIPANVRYDKDLTANAKLLFGEMTALSNEKGYCWATNSYFANLYNVKNETISRWISQLIKKGYIKSVIIYKNGSKEIDSRRLYIGNSPIDENINTYCQENQRPIDENINTPIDRKVKENTTSNNTTSNNIYSRIVDYLNKKADTKYRSTTKKNKDLIKARINEGFKEEDFYKVIDIKVKEWSNTEMVKYLRPETLFGTKFEGYLNQKGSGLNGQYINREHGDRWSTGENKKSFNVNTESQYGELSDEDRQRAEELI